MANPLASSTIVEKLRGIIARNNLPLTVQSTTLRHVRVTFDMPVSVKGAYAVEPRTGFEFTKDSNRVAWPRKDGAAEHDYRWTMDFKYNSYGFKSRLQNKSGSFNWMGAEQDILSWWDYCQNNIEAAEREARKRIAAESVVNDPQVQALASKYRGLVEASVDRYGDAINIGVSRYGAGFQAEVKLVKNMLTPGHVVLVMEALYSLSLGLATVDSEPS